MIGLLAPACGLFGPGRPAQPEPEKPQADTIRDPTRDTVVRIPDTLTPVELRAAIRDSLYPRVRRDTYRVALMLPVFSDSSGLSRRDRQVAEAARNFYRGARMGYDTLRRCGRKLHVSLYDTRNDSIFLQKALQELQERPPDLVIGPLFSRHYKQLRPFSNDHEVNFLSPVVDVYSYLDSAPYIMSVKPPTHLLGGEVARLINRSFTKSRIILVNEKLTIEEGDGLPMDTVLLTRESRMLRDSFLQHIDTNRNSIFLNQAFSANDLNKVRNKELEQKAANEDEQGKEPEGVQDTLLVDSLKTIVVITSQNESFVGAMINNFRQRAGNGVLVGLPAWLNYRTIYTRQISRFNLHVIADFHIDYRSADVQQFVRHYRSRYFQEPDRYAFRGFSLAVGMSRQFSENGTYFQNGATNDQGYQPFLFGGLQLAQQAPPFGGHYNRYFNWLKFVDFDFRPIPHHSKNP